VDSQLDPEMAAFRQQFEQRSPLHDRSARPERFDHRLCAYNRKQPAGLGVLKLRGICNTDGVLCPTASEFKAYVMIAHQAQLVELFERLPASFRGAEIGVHQGMTSEILLRHFSGLFLHMVDSWTTHPPDSAYYLSEDENSRWTKAQQDEFKAQAISRTDFARTRRKVHHCSSREAAGAIEPRSLDFVFLDAGHDYSSVVEDILIWWPKVKSGGLLTGHDYGHRKEAANLFGVSQAVNELFTGVFQLGSGKVWWVNKMRRIVPTAPRLQ
jgi:hypothetical protein